MTGGGKTLQYINLETLEPHLISNYFANTTVINNWEKLSSIPEWVHIGKGSHCLFVELFEKKWGSNVSKL